MPARLKIEEQSVGDVTVLRLAGRLELDEGDIIFRDYVNQLLDKGCRRLLLDMKNVTRLDSAGIGILVSKFVSLRRKGGTIKLLHLTARTNHLMDITKLTTVFEIYDDEARALASFAAGSATTV